MYKMRILNHQVIEATLTMEDAIKAVEQAFLLYSRKEAGLFPTITHEFEKEKNDFDIRSGHLKGANLYGIKIVGWVADNPVLRGVPALSGLVLVMNIETGQPVGLVDGMSITNIRTGAAGALGARLLARKDSRCVLICGAGAQGRSQLMGLSRVLPHLDRVVICDKHFEAAEAYAREQALIHPYDFVPIRMEELPDHAPEADVIVTATPSHEPYLRKEWVRPGTHINAIGADARGKQELEATLPASGRLVVDSREQAFQSGESQYAMELGLIDVDSVAEIGEILAGMRPGRTSTEEITIFDATGMALQDIVTADLALKRAEERGLGIVVEM